MSEIKNKITVKYFALLREQAKRDQEDLESFATTPLELFSELQKKYGFRIDQKILRVAINNQFAKMDTLLKPNDIVVFLPPVAGG